MRRNFHLWLLAAACAAGTETAVAQAPAAGLPVETTYVEEMVTRYQPVQRRVIVPVAVAKPANPGPLAGLATELGFASRGAWNVRWEERVETSYVPVTRREYRPQRITAAKPLPPLVLAKRPATAPPNGAGSLATSATRPRGPVREYDQLPLVAVQAPPPQRPAPRAAQPGVLVPRR